MDAHFSQSAHCGNSYPFIAVLLQQPIRLAISLRQPAPVSFPPERDGRISHRCSPIRTGLCGFPPRDNRRDKHRMLTRHSDADDGAAAH
jgi:hypothetical protein